MKGEMMLRKDKERALTKEETTFWFLWVEKK